MRPLRWPDEALLEAEHAISHYAEIDIPLAEDFCGHLSGHLSQVDLPATCPTFGHLSQVDLQAERNLAQALLSKQPFSPTTDTRRVSPPRMLHAGTTYMVTRTTANRLYLLVPSAFLNDVIRYCIALAKRGLKIEVHGFSAESNHLHIVITDYATDLPAFMRELCRALAKCMLAYYRSLEPTRTIETLWSPGSYSAVALTTPEAVIEKIAYVLTNPVKDGLVADYRDWPGANSRPHHWRLSPRWVHRPELYFSQDDDELEQLPFELTVPPMLRDRPLDVAIAQVETRVRDVQTMHRRAREHSGKPFLGKKAVLRMDPFDAPKGARRRGDVNPQLASGGDGETMSTAKRLLREFRASYRDAWRKFRAGVIACFPAGTYLMRVRMRVRCDEFTPPWCLAALQCGA